MRNRIYIAAVVVLGAIAFGSVGLNKLTSGSSAPPVAAMPDVVPAALLSAFVCTSTSLPAGNVGGMAAIDRLRTGRHQGYERLVIQFQATRPGSVELRPQSGTNFIQGASGLPITLAGSNGLLVTIRGADMHSSFGGRTDFVTGYKTLAEVRQVQDFEGVVQLGVGITGPACYRAFPLTKPDRLVIDIKAQ